MHTEVNMEDQKVLKDFKNVFATPNGMRVLQRILWEAGYYSASTAPEDLPLKNFSVWLMQMVGGNNIEAAVNAIIKAAHQTPLKGE